ncbi:Anp1-domain-containing protein [Xylariales sp. AK1849]|nr:Anp1-domain-containing protein [Xylariales sp. AK1849]
MRLNYTRLSAISAALLFLLLLFYTTEPRRRSLSCKTLWSCVGNRPHRYPHHLPQHPKFNQRGGTLRDGSHYIERELSDTNPEALILVLNRDQYSWSKDFRSTDRSIYDFLDLLITTGVDFTTVSLGMMTSSRDEFLDMERATASLPFARTSIYFQANDGPEFSYSERHSPAVQRERRAEIARLRNYLMLRSLMDEQHIIWVDADVVEFSKGILQTILALAEQRDDVGLMTARCQQHLIENYDKNAWAYDRNVPLLLSSVSDDERNEAVDQLVGTRHYVDELTHNTSDSDLLSLDSVGGTLLYIRAELVRQGLVFPTYNVIGTTWSQEGWVGIETEGICYAASHFRGGRCFVLGGSHHVRHADLG